MYGVVELVNPVRNVCRVPSPSDCSFQFLEAGHGEIIRDRVSGVVIRPLRVERESYALQGQAGVDVLFDGLIAAGMALAGAVVYTFVLSISQITLKDPSRKKKKSK